MEHIKKLVIGNRTLDNNLILAPMAGVTDGPAISFAVQGAGCGAFVHGNGEREGDSVQ